MAKNAEKGPNGSNMNTICHVVTKLSEGYEPFQRSPLLQFLQAVFKRFVFREALQPVTNWQLLYRMMQDRINVRIYLVCQIG
jgi:hypothetical protein